MEFRCLWITAKLLCVQDIFRNKYVHLKMIGTNTLIYSFIRPREIISLKKLLNCISVDILSALFKERGICDLIKGLLM